MGLSPSVVSASARRATAAVGCGGAGRTATASAAASGVRARGVASSQAEELHLSAIVTDELVLCVADAILCRSIASVLYKADSVLDKLLVSYVDGRDN